MMQQGPDRATQRERLYEIAKFYGKDKADTRLNQLIDIYHAKLDQLPIPRSRTDITYYVSELMNNIGIDPVTYEEKWWTRNSFYVAEASRFGFTKNEWKNLAEYIINV